MLMVVMTDMLIAVALMAIFAILSCCEVVDHLLLLLLEIDWIGLTHIVDELASDSIWAVAGHAVLLAEFGLVEDGDVRLYHYL